MIPEKPTIDDILKNRVNYGFLATDEDDDIRNIVEAEQYHEHHGFDLSKSDPIAMEATRQAAKNYNTRKVVTFKAHSGSLEKFKQRAQNEGIPYQTLLNSVMKKYAEGGLVEKEDFYIVK